MRYIASPYSSPNPAAREARFKAVCRVAGLLMRRGLHVYSPIAHTHPIAVECDLPKDFEFWQSFDEAMLSRCDALLVLTLPGWQESRGVKAEIEIAGQLGLPVDYIDEQGRSVEP